MKYLFVLILIFLSNICFGSLYVNYGVENDHNSYVSDYYYFNLIYYSQRTCISSYHSNPIIFRADGKRYINDLSHEFPVQFSVCGTYWKGGAWGYRNGFYNYYGNVYYFYSSYNYIPEITTNIPEPSSLLLLGGFWILFHKKAIEKRKK